MPIQRRLPKRGFTNFTRVEFQVVNILDLDNLKKIEKVTPEVMYDKGLVRKKNQPIKILGSGELKAKLEVSAHGFSKSAKEKIENAGGRISLL